MTELDKKWNMQYEQLVEYKRKKGDCLVPRKYEQDKSLTEWVSQQRTRHKDETIRPDRKKLLDEIEFVWKPDHAHRAHDFKPDDKLWHQQYEKLLEYKRINGHCKVPKPYAKDKALGAWVSNQRARHTNNKMLPDRKELLDAIEFVWKVHSLATRSSTNDVRGLAI
jgi:hypothetical protein